MLVREAVDEYIASLKRLQPLTVAGYTQRLAVFCDWCECQQPPIELETIRRVVVDAFVVFLRDTRTPHKVESVQISTYTLQGYVAAILAFLHWCLDDEEYSAFVKAATVGRIKKPKLEQTVIEIFDKAQLDALFLSCKQEYNGHLQTRDKAILSLLLDTGIRASELCQLVIGNVHTDPRDAFVKVHGKGDKWREVGLGDLSRRDMKSYLRLYRLDAARSDVVFVNRYGRGLTVNGLEQIIRRLGKWAEVEGVRCSPHTFRHTFACNYLINGGDVYVLSRLMGHTSVQVTERYLKAVKASQARRIGRSVLDDVK